MKLGEAVAVFGTKRSGSRYMKDAYAPYYVSYALDGTYACTCDIWGNQKGPKEKRRCKHIRMVIGGEEDDRRLAESPVDRFVRATTGERVTWAP